MKKNNIYVILWMSFLLISSFSCKKYIDIDIKGVEDMLVVNSVLSADSGMTVLISRSRHIQDTNQLERINDAIVEISDEDGNRQVLLFNDSLYVSAELPIVSGKKYTLAASADGFDPVNSECIIPYPVNSFELDTSARKDEYGNEFIKLNLKFEDDKSVDNYYLFSIRVSYQSVYKQYFMPGDTMYYEDGEFVVAEGFDSIVHIYDMDYYQGLYSEDVSWEASDLTTGGALFSDKLFDETGHALSAAVPTYFLYDAKDSVRLDFTLSVITKDYYDYLKTLYNFRMSDGDLFAVPVTVDNNIENGLGVFGARALTSKTMMLPKKEYNWDDYLY